MNYDKCSSPIAIAIFASGRGSNAKNIINHFKTSDIVKCSLLCTDNPRSGVFALAKEHSLPVLFIEKEYLGDGSYLIDKLQQYAIDIVVLAGYLKLIPSELVASYARRIINIHPALLPAYGGKGMYGINVHEAVIKAGEKISGITIHYVDPQYDRGEIIFQKELLINAKWSANELRKEVLALEHTFYPIIIEEICNKLVKDRNFLN